MNKLNKIILWLVVIIVVVGLIWLGYSEDIASEKNKETFDINFNSLSYQLPYHTKICIPKVKKYCDENGICENMKPEVFVLIDKSNNFSYRCDKNPCDKYPVKILDDEFFKNIKPINDKDFNLKISSDNKYYEFVSLGLDVFLSYGECEDK